MTSAVGCGLRLGLAIAVAVLAVTARNAAAYPQFQLARDQTCSGCHLSPAGGGLLGENGLVAAEAMSQWGTPPDPFYGKVALPSWLALGGDLRGASGLDATPARELVTFPMQAELHAAVSAGHFQLYVTAGARDPQDGHTESTLFASREHWLQLHDDPGSAYGLFVRAGRFEPVFGLRQAEHVDYDRRYGGTPLYGEAYGASVEEVQPGWEVHATGFVHDPLLTDSIERGDGGTLYAEARVTKTTALGLEGKVDVTPDDHEEYAGVVAKHWFASPGILVQGEVIGIHQKVLAAGGGQDEQLVGYVLGSYALGALLIDLGVGADEPDLHVRYLDQEAVDVNVHWFVTSHLELVWANRLQMLELGEGGLSSGYSLGMIHYRI